MRTWLLFSALTLGAGYNLPYPAPVGSPDAAPDATPDADPDTVTGTSIVRHYASDGVTTAPEDLGTYAIKAYVPDDAAAGKLRVIDAEVTGLGMFAIHGIPPGTGYYLSLAPAGTSTPTLYWTTARTLDLGYPVVGRANVAPLTVPTLVHVALTTVGRWWSVDSLSALSAGAATDQVSGASDPAPGATTLGGEDFDWSFAASEDPQRTTPGQLSGDDLELVHARELPTGDGGVASAVIEIATWTGETQTPGVTLPVSGAMSTVPQSESTLISVDPVAVRQIFAAAYASESLQVGAYAAPGADHGTSLVAPLYEYSRGLFGETTPIAVSIGHGLPYPTTWPIYQIVSYTRVVRRLHRTGAGRTSLIASVTSSEPRSTTVSFVAHVAVPRNLHVDGGSADDRVIPFDGTTPVSLSWDAAASATFYKIVAARTGTKTSNNVLRPVATVFTSTTSVVMPAALFSDGDRYVFTVEAWRSPIAFATGSLRDYQRPTYTASAVSGVLFFSTSCGDGITQTGEDCDTMGESATCNYDCTAAHCGDGLRNATAGEACDDGDVGGASCDRDCTLPICGDGVVNAYAGEACDDGNAKDDGNGCTATCTYRHDLCGDGVVQLGEGCDDANSVNTDACTNACTNALCGDGFIQPSNTEQCDDGNTISGDGCSTDCQTEP